MSSTRPSLSAAATTTAASDTSRRPHVDEYNPQNDSIVESVVGAEQQQTSSKNDDADADAATTAMSSPPSTNPSRTIPWKDSSALQRLRSARNMSIGASAAVSNSTSARRLSVHRTADDDATNTYISSLISDLHKSLQHLLQQSSSSATTTSINITPKQVEEWAVFIHTCTSSNNRVAGYHNIHRLFEITTGADPIQLIAAFFRDTINCFVDNGLSEPQKTMLGSGDNNNDGIIVVVDTMDDDNNGRSGGRIVQQDVPSSSLDKNKQHPHFGMILDLFGVSPGQVLTDRTLDAFLSAIVMTKCLQDTLTTSQLAQILVCLEATIPFRGNGALETLYQRLEGVNDKYDLQLTSHDLVEAIQRAADLSNRSHGNFSTRDVKFFLDHTWSLLPEHNVALRRTYLYTVLDFQAAVKSMYDFLHSLDPSTIYVSFRGVPKQDEMIQFEQAATGNLNLGISYVRAELLSVSTVAAFALLSGGDAPMSYFVGDLPNRSRNNNNNNSSDDTTTTATTTRVVEDDKNCPIPPPSSLDKNKWNHQVYDILKGGRNCEVTFDTRNSPLAAYLYARLGDEEMERIVHESLTFPFDDKVSRALLSRLPKEAVELIGRNVATIAISRAERIETILKELEES